MTNIKTLTNVLRCTCAATKGMAFNQVITRLTNHLNLHMLHISGTQVVILNNMFSHATLRFGSDQYSAVSKMDTLTLDMIKEYLGYISSPMTSLLSISHGSQELLVSSEWTEPEDMEGSQLNHLDNPVTLGNQMLVTLEEASQRISCDEVYRAPTDQTMDTDVHSHKHQDKAKQKKSHSSDSPRQPLRQINNTMQLEERRSSGSSKLLPNNRDQRTHVSKFND